MDKNHLQHESIDPSHYDKCSEGYDGFNESNSEQTNQLLAKFLKEHGVKSVLDLTCGTGSQVFYLSNEGFDVIGSDINRGMLDIARGKAETSQLDLKFLEGDMRTSEIGQFDAVITIFNAVGHLTKTDFEKAMINVQKNLKKGGIYIFDIFNKDYLLDGDNITNLTIDWQKKAGEITSRQIQYSTIDAEGVLASFTTHIEQVGSHKSKVTESVQTLQVYSAKQLEEMLTWAGFTDVSHCTIDGSKFIELEHDRILTIAIRV